MESGRSCFFLCVLDTQEDMFVDVCAFDQLCGTHFNCRLNEKLCMVSPIFLWYNGTDK